MTVIFGILGILCLIYYGVIVIYSGAGTSFSAIWIVRRYPPGFNNVVATVTGQIPAFTIPSILCASAPPE